MPADRAQPTVAVVIETVNEETEPTINLPTVLDGLSRQSYPRELTETLVVVQPDNHELLERLRSDHPHVRVVLCEDPNYYPMKTAGARAATADIVACLDSDCLPVPGWVESFVDEIVAGADLVAGKTRYPEGSPFGLTFGVLNFGYIFADAEGRASGFLPNNFAVRRDLLERHPFDPRARRSGAAHLLGHRLRQLGYKLVYQPRMRVTHSSYSPAIELQMRVKSGFDCVNLADWDESGALEEGQLIKRSPLALALVFARRVVFDVRNLLTNRRDLDIAVWQLPWFFLISPAIRALEMGAALLTIARPDYLRKKYGW
jgi:glycosyltransferase involved in cell wall biosynthesis